MLDWCVEAIVAEDKWLTKWVLSGEEARVRLLRSVACGAGAAMRHQTHHCYTMGPTLSARTRSLR
jgi:tartrate dehydratase beta subunit/fumarate hydratase class I family protein